MALTALLVLPVSAATALAEPGPTTAPSVTAQLAHSTLTPDTQTVAAMVARRRCHGPGALVITPRGRLKQVGLARGLRVYAHKVPGYFVALCPTTSQRP